MAFCGCRVHAAEPALGLGGHSSDLYRDLRGSDDDDATFEQAADVAEREQAGQAEMSRIVSTSVAPSMTETRSRPHGRA